MSQYSLHGKKISETFPRVLQITSGDTVLDGSGDTRNLSVQGNFSATTIFSGSTNLYDIFLTTADGNDITRVQPGTNTYTGGTNNFPTVNVSALTINNIAVSGTALFNSLSANTISGQTYFSGNTTLSTIIQALSIDAEKDKLNLYQASTGSAFFGGIGISSDPTKFNIGIVHGWFIDNTTDTENPTKLHITFSAQSGITPSALTTHNVTYIAINSVGSVVQQTIPFDQTQERTLIKLGVVGHPNRTTITNFNNQPQNILSPTLQLRDIASGLGFFNKEGNIFSSFNGTDLKISKSVGKAIFRLGGNSIINPLNPNIVTIAQRLGQTFRYRLQGGLDIGTVSVIDPNKYDLNNVLTAVPNNKWTIQRISMFPLAAGSIIIQPGQNVYGTFAEARAAIDREIFIIDANIAENALLRCFLIVQEGTTVLMNSLFFESGKFGTSNGVGGSGTSTLQSAYTNANDPEILTDATRLAVSIRRGSSADTDNILEGQNGAGTNTFTLTGNGGVIASTLSATTLSGGTIFSGSTELSSLLNSATATLTNKRITVRIGTETSSATSTPTADSVDQWNVTALAVADAFAAPTGTPTDGQNLMIRIRDNGTARALTWNAIYEASSDLALPTTTIINRTLWLGFRYNTVAVRWQLLAVLNNFTL